MILSEYQEMIHHQIYLIAFGCNLQIAGAFWYLLAVERKDTCWQKACTESIKCDISFLYCGNKILPGFHEWRRVSDDVLSNNCSVDDDGNSSFHYGIYTQAMSSDIVASRKFVTKFFYCLWWGLQNLRYILQNIFLI